MESRLRERGCCSCKYLECHCNFQDLLYSLPSWVGPLFLNEMRSWRHQKHWSDKTRRQRFRLYLIETEEKIANDSEMIPYHREISLELLECIESLSCNTAYSVDKRFTKIRQFLREIFRLMIASEHGLYYCLIEKIKIVYNDSRC